MAEFIPKVPSLPVDCSPHPPHFFVRVFLRWAFLIGGVWMLSQTPLAMAAVGEEATTEQIPYDQLVQELNSMVHRRERQRVQVDSQDPFDQLQIHSSFGFVQSIDTLLVNERTISRHEDGIQLSIGIDLFSPEWVAEGILKNFGQSTQNGTSFALREFDLRLGYLQMAPKPKMKFRLANGLGARYLRYSNSWLNIATYQTTPVYTLGMGFLIPMGLHFDLDIEMQGHLPLISESIDRHGLSLVLRLDNVF